MKFGTRRFLWSRDAKTRDAKILYNSDLVKLPYLHGNITSFFLPKFNVKLPS